MVGIFFELISIKKARQMTGLILLKFILISLTLQLS